MISHLILAATLLFAEPGKPDPATPAALAPAVKFPSLVYQGETGPGKGRHIVFIASDHEYKSEESLPELAKILAKRQGFTCTVLFGLDAASGEIAPGRSFIPGTEELEHADLLVLFTRFQDLPAAQMQPIVNYLKRGGGIVGLRTATHAFKFPKTSDYAKFSYDYRGADFPGGFGRQVLGETWVDHNGRNFAESVRLEVIPAQQQHPVLSGVTQAWSELSSYLAAPLPDSQVLMTAQPLTTMDPHSAPHPKHRPAPAVWVRSYQLAGGQPGRTFATTHGGPADLRNDGFRRLMVNACFWACGLEKAISPDLDTALVGPYRPTWSGPERDSRAPHVKPQDLAGWDSPLLPAPPLPAQKQKQK